MKDSNNRKKVSAKKPSKFTNKTNVPEIDPKTKKDLSSKKNPMHLLTKRLRNKKRRNFLLR
ncbi:hypothetical protein LEP1GSC137_2212 [Leptospira borgpetersenii str. Noumea 25]|nr:hypothetical protein LEP1GSC137_2212 [Leptospira borgpetersenii str. Noumea 25]